MPGVLIDANLLVLRVVGSAGKGFIAKHKRLRKFSSEDYELPAKLEAGFEKTMVTPNTLTETSNLLAQHKDPERTKFFRHLGSLIRESKEVIVKSVPASKNPNFERLGLTDAVLLELVSERTPLLTVDASLYHAALAKGGRAAFNFTHFRTFE